MESCVKSALGQNTRYNFEVILVDDGSSDSTGDIADQYRQFSNIKIIHQNNAGLSEARNTGLRNAKGSYIMFLDVDDMLTDEVVESLLACAYQMGADFVEGGFNRVSENGEVLGTVAHKEGEIKILLWNCKVMRG